MLVVIIVAIAYALVSLVTWAIMFFPTDQKFGGWLDRGRVNWPKAGMCLVAAAFWPVLVWCWLRSEH